MIAELGGQRSDRGMYEAALTVFALVRTGATAPWLVTTAVWMTYERLANVRGMAGQALAAVQTSSSAKRLHESRLRALLAEDGTYVPLSVLEGHRATPESLSPSTIRVVRGLAATHPSALVRSKAAEVLSETQHHHEAARFEAKTRRRRWRSRHD